MTDHELLELAAKAAGFVIFGSTPGRPGVDICGKTSGSKVKWWSPLTDDGDALRLAAKIRLDIRIYEDETVAETPWVTGDQRAGGSDVLANTRRAIVLAAAQIGEMRKGQPS